VVPARPLAVAAPSGPTATLQRLPAAGFDADEVDTATDLGPLALAARADQDLRASIHPSL